MVILTNENIPQWFITVSLKYNNLPPVVHNGHFEIWQYSLFESYLCRLDSQQLLFSGLWNNENSLTTSFQKDGNILFETCYNLAKYFVMKFDLIAQILLGYLLENKQQKPNKTPTFFFIKKFLNKKKVG